MGYVKRLPGSCAPARFLNLSSFQVKGDIGMEIDKIYFHESLNDILFDGCPSFQSLDIMIREGGGVNISIVQKSAS